MPGATVQKNVPKTLLAVENCKHRYLTRDRHRILFDPAPRVSFNHWCCRSAARSKASADRKIAIGGKVSSLQLLMPLAA